METIKERRKWECATSPYSILEALDVKKDNKFIINKLGDGYTLKWILRKRYEKDLSEKELENLYDKMYNAFFERYKFVDTYWLNLEGFETAVELSRKSNVSAPDLIHLATAIEAECDLLVTSDEFFCKQANNFISSCSPENFQEKLKELKFQI